MSTYTTVLCTYLLTTTDTVLVDYDIYQQFCLDTPNIFYSLNVMIIPCPGYSYYTEKRFLER